ncbi:MAG: acyl-CoA thioesterase [Deltaproteobacteria bacterium]|nr:acyl-CoA thioesterase [Deltaproteobacteria bacterium]
MTQQGDARRVSETALSVAQLMMPSHANPAGNIHGGQLMKMIDDAAGAVAVRHARANMVTASIDRLDFHAPVYVGNLVVLKASINFVGRTSMEIGVRVEAEDLRRGDVRHTASAYLTFVSLDDEGKPQEIPGLLLETDEERRRWEAGASRRRDRMRSRGLLRDQGLEKPLG